MQAHDKCGSLRKASFIHENTYILAATADTMLSKITEQRSETIYAQCYVLFCLYVFIAAMEQETRCFQYW